MLHAIRANKSRLYRRYLGERDGSEKLVHEEDEITSTVLGPLDFLNATDNQTFFQKLLLASGRSHDLLSAPIESAVIDFWPRRRTAGRTYIEPDATVQLSWPDGRKLVLLIEVKWNAQESGTDQLASQWTDFLNNDERSDGLHLFIAKAGSAAMIAAMTYIEERSAWSVDEGEGKLALISWTVVRSVLEDISSNNSEIGRWAKACSAFLDKLGIRAFTGFDGLISKKISLNLPSRVHEPIFWNGPIWWNENAIKPSKIGATSSIFFERR